MFMQAWNLKNLRIPQHKQGGRDSVQDEQLQSVTYTFLKKTKNKNKFTIAKAYFITVLCDNDLVNFFAY